MLAGAALQAHKLEVMGTRDDDNDVNDEADRAKLHFVQGMGLLFRAAGEAAEGLRKGIDKSDVGKQLDVAGRELYRAANNVVSRLGTEVFFGSKDKEKKNDDKKADDDPPRYAPGEKPKGPTKEDPGFRIATDDDEPK
jgi:hypothetical protein